MHETLFLFRFSKLLLGFSNDPPWLTVDLARAPDTRFRGIMCDDCVTKRQKCKPFVYEADRYF
jgi:hypothetical protein